MNYDKYLSDRQKLQSQAQALINAGTKESFEKADELLDQMSKLDEQYTAETRLQMANDRVMNSEPRGILLPWMSGEHMDMVSGRCYYTGAEPQDNTFLSAAQTMVDIARRENPDAVTLLNMDGALGSIVRGMVTGKWDSLELKNIVTTTSSGTLIPSVLSAQIIDLMRNLSLFTAAGVPVAYMDSNNLTISRVKTDPTFKFKQEGEAAEESSFELDGVELKSKTAYGYAYITLEAIQSSQNLDTVLRQVFAAAMANAIDVAMLYGQKAGSGGYDSFAPSGIMNDSDILVTQSGETPSYDDIVKAAGAIRRANGVPMTWAVNAATDEALELLKDSTGQYLAPPKALDSLQKIVSNQLAASDETGYDALVFDPKAMLIGVQNNLQIKIIEDEACLKRGLVGFQIYSMLDCKVVRPKAICKVTGIGKAAE